MYGQEEKSRLDDKDYNHRFDTINSHDIPSLMPVKRPHIANPVHKITIDQNDQNCTE